MDMVSGARAGTRGRSGARRWTGVLAAIAVAAASVLGAQAPATAAPADDIHALVNQARWDAGLPGLKRNAAMDQVALDWARQMAANNQMAHNPDYAQQIPAGWTRAGENVARGQQTGQAMFTAWMNSPGHRANIMGDYTDIGIAFISANGTTWGVQVFAKYPNSAGPLPPSAPPGVEAERISSDRYGIPTSLADRFTPDASTVYVVNASSYANALNASAAAGAAGAPLLLVSSSTVPGSVRAQLIQMDPDRIIVVGSTASVSASVEAALGAYAPVQRISGADRYDISRAVVRSSHPDGAPVVFIATGRTYQTGLATAAVAGARNAPLLVVDGAASTLPTATRALIAELGATRVIVAGNTSTVSSGIASSADSVPGVVVQRVSSTSSYSLPAALAKAFPPSSDAALVVSGEVWPAALAAGAAAGASGSALYLAKPDCFPSTALSSIASTGVSTVYLLGSTTTLSPAVEAFSPCS